MNLNLIKNIISEEGLNVEELFKLYLVEENLEANMEKKLKNIRLEEIKGIVEGKFFGIVEDRLLYAIPLLFLENECFSLNDDIKLYLKDLLKKSIKCYTDNETSMLNNTKIENNEERLLYILQVFLLNFDNVMMGKKELDIDNNLFAKSKVQYENLSRKDILGIRKEWKEAIIKGKESLSNIPKEIYSILSLKESIKLFEEVIKKCPSCISELPEQFRNEKIIGRLIATNFAAYQYLDKVVYNEDFVIKSIKKNWKLALNNEEIAKNKEYALAAISADYRALECVSEELRNDKEVVLEAVKKNGSALKYAVEELKKDKEFVLEVVKENGSALKYASNKLRNDKEVVLEAVKNNGYALEYASEELRKDKEFVLEAVKQNGYVFQYASEELRKDKEFVLEVVKKKGSALEYASEELKKDKEVVLEAVRHDDGIPFYDWALQYASNKLRNDKEVVLEAVKKNGSALKYASEELKKDKEVVLEAVKNHGGALSYASEELRKDKEVVLEAKKKGWIGS